MLSRPLVDTANFIRRDLNDIGRSDIGMDLNADNCHIASTNRGFLELRLAFGRAELFLEHGNIVADVLELIADFGGVVCGEAVERVTDTLAGNPPRNLLVCPVTHRREVVEPIHKGDTDTNGATLHLPIGRKFIPRTACVYEAPHKDVRTAHGNRISFAGLNTNQLRIVYLAKPYSSRHKCTVAVGGCHHNSKTTLGNFTGDGNLIVDSLHVLASVLENNIGFHVFSFLPACDKDLWEQKM